MRRRDFIRTLTALAASSAYGPACANDKPTIAILLKSMRNEYFQKMAEGARQHERQHGAKYSLIIEGIDVETDYARQTELVKRLLAKQINALIAVPADSVEMVNPLLKVIQAGVLVINLDNKLDDRALSNFGVNIPFVGPSNFAGARTCGEYMAKLLPSGSNVGIIEGPSAHINAKARTDGYRTAMQNAGMYVAGILAGDWVIEGGMSAAQELMQRTPTIKALLCGNDNMAIGASKALENLGLAGKVLVSGYDNIPAVHDYIGGRKIAATIDQFPGRQAEYAIELALKSLESHTKQNDLPTIVQTPVELINHV